MTYIIVREETEQKLHLCREPSGRAWAILIALISLGLGAAYYSIDYVLWKMAYLSGAVFVGLSCMEDWEDCILDKSTGQVNFKKQSLIQKLFQATKGQKTVTANLEDITEVRVQEEEVKYGSVGYQVVFQFQDGYSLGVCETATMEDRSEHEDLAHKINTFLQLDSKPRMPSSAPFLDTPNGDDTSSSATEESFEHIDKTDFIDEDAPPFATQAEPQEDSPFAKD